MANIMRIISFLLIFCMMTCVLPINNVYAAKGDLGEGYNVNNIDFTFNTVDGEKVSSDSNGNIKVIVFARTNGNCTNSNEVMKSICGVGWSTLEEIDTLIVDIDQRDASGVKATGESFEPWKVKFCYDESSASSDMLWRYIEATSGKADSVTLPIIVVIDRNNKVQYLKTGYISAKDLYNYIEPLLYEEEIEEEEEVVVGKDRIEIYTEGFYDYDSAEDVFRLTNEARVSEGKTKLVMDEKLTEIAMHRAAEQALLYNHVRPNGTKWHTLLSGKYLSGAGENIAFGQYSADSVTTAWLNSEGHRENIMNSDYTSIGVGSFMHNGTRFWVQIFSSYTETAYSDKSVASKDVVLDAIPLNVGEFILEAYDNELKVGENTNVSMTVNNLAFSSLKLNVKPDNVIFKSSDENIATVDASGNVTAVSEGKVKVTAILDETLVAKCDLVVREVQTEEPFIAGDIDNDKNVTAVDSLLVLKHAAKLEILNDEEMTVANLDNNSIIDANDALIILKIAAKLI